MTLADIEAAAQKANAAGFVGDFAEKYQTHCGAMGSQLSGGQKQRVAIARALVRIKREGETNESEKKKGTRGDREHETKRWSGSRGGDSFSGLSRLGDGDNAARR